MGNHIYTRTGDKGDTALFGGSRVPKQHARVEAYGTVDEANASIGKAKALAGEDDMFDRIHAVQNRLFTLAAEVASDPTGVSNLSNIINEEDITELERMVDTCMNITGPQKHFIIPGRDPISAQYHVARTIVRRAERRVLTASETTVIRPQVITYLNRLSDTLYALARLYEHRHEVAVITQVVAQTISTITEQTGTPPNKQDVVQAVVAAIEDKHRVVFG